jgi:AAA family ATP:ADP antiporter
VFVDSLATGIGGVLLIVFINAFNITVGQVSFIVIVLIVVWVFFQLKVRKEYIDSFRIAIEKRTIDPEEESINVEDASIYENLLKVLESKNERQILYVLSLLENVRRNEFIPYLEKLLSYPSVEIRIKVISMLIKYEEIDFSEKIANFVEDKSENIKKSSIQYLLKKSQDKENMLRGFLDNPDLQVSGSAMLIAAQQIKEDRTLREQYNLRDLFESRYQQYLEGDAKPEAKKYAKMIVAEAVGITNDSELHPYLRSLLKDKDIEVRRAAITNAGITRATEFIPLILENLAARFVRKYAREALAEYGEEIINDLVQLMQNLNENRQVRLAIPKVLALIGSQKSADALINSLKVADLDLRYETLRALNKLKVKFPILKFDDKYLKDHLTDERKNYYRMLTILYEQNRKENRERHSESTKNNNDDVKKARHLLIGALEEKLDSNLDRVFRLLGLKYLQHDIFNAYEGIKSQKADLRANAVEFLDNILDFNLKRLIIPIVESKSFDSLVYKSHELFGFEVPSETDCLQLLLNGEDNWLKSCALFLLAFLKQRDCIAMVKKLTSDSDFVVRETANYTFERMSD